MRRMAAKSSADLLNQKLKNLNAILCRLGEFLNVVRWIGFGAGGLAVIIIIIAGVLLIRDAGEREDAALEQNAETNVRSCDYLMKWLILRKVI